MGDVIGIIEIPTDNDGYVLMQCPLCKEYFKIASSDYGDEGVTELRCPNCGLASDSYLTEDVIELAITKATNYGMNKTYDEMKKWEKKFKGKSVSFKAGEKPKEEYESPIRPTIEAMTIHRYACCNKSAKIKPLLEITGSYCPFCGVREFGTE